MKKELKCFWRPSPSLQGPLPSIAHISLIDIGSAVTGYYSFRALSPKVFLNLETSGCYVSKFSRNRD